MKKRFLSTLLAAVMVGTMLTGCGGAEKSGGDDNFSEFQ